MTEKRPRVRFAPSPTGELHLGNARTALFNWIFAKQKNGTFVLRIEDTDQKRAAGSYEQNLCDDLHWLGIEWDEGPGREGPFGPYHQSRRLEIYDTELRRLIESGRVYPCYCEEQELENERRNLVVQHQAPRYRGTCRQLSSEERRKREGSNKKPAYRFRIDQGPVTFRDMIRGDMKFDATAIGDCIIMRSNGLPAYNFAVVVDDHMMEISHVIRGADHLSNTAVQILLYHALGYRPPLFAHHSLILGSDRNKLSKRHGSVSVREYKDRGFLPEALVNYLSLLGYSFGAGAEIRTASEIVDLFALQETGKSGAIFDEDKLKWLNGMHIRKQSPEHLLQSLTPFMEKAGYRIDDANDRRRALAVIEVVKDNLHTLDEIGEYLPLFTDRRFHLSKEAREVLLERDSMPTVQAFYDSIVSITDDEGDFYESALEKVSKTTGKKGRSLFLPLRSAITGLTKGPELDRVVAILGRQSVVGRLHWTIREISSSG